MQILKCMKKYFENSKSKLNGIKKKNQKQKKNKQKKQTKNKQTKKHCDFFWF